MTKGREYYEQVATFDEWKEWYANTEKPQYDHPDITTDAVIVKFDTKTNEIKVLLNKRLIHPSIDTWTLPGTFLHTSEKNIQESIKRLYRDKLGVTYEYSSSHIDQLSTYSDIDRDPRGQIVSVVHIVYTHQDIPETEVLKWFSLEDISVLKLGFDHKIIIEDAIARMQSQFNWTPFLLKSLPSKFTLGQSIHLKAYLFDFDYKKVNRANYRKSLLKFAKKVEEVPVALYSTTL